MNPRNCSIGGTYATPCAEEKTYSLRLAQPVTIWVGKSRTLPLILNASGSWASTSQKGERYSLRWFLGRPLSKRCVKLAG
jgi:hypothetical protein